MIRTRLKCLTVCLVTLGIQVHCADAASAAESPFVAGFERLGRHREIDDVAAGRLLLTELSCTACHAADDALLSPKRGPRLNGAGNRIHGDWLRRFLADPAQIKPGTTMPAMLASLPPDEQQASIDALVAFLQSQVKPFPEIKGSGARPVPNEFWNLGDAEQGQRLFHQIGCVACHAPDESWETVETKPTPLEDILEQLDPEELAEAGLLSAARRVESVPLGSPAAKYSPRSLTYFLLQPHSIRPAGRMPDFQLGVVEASDIAAWLLQRDSADPAAIRLPQSPSKELIDRGRLLFSELGCISCHDVDNVPAMTGAAPLQALNADSDRQCLGTPQSGIPHFAVDNEQRTALRAALASTAAFDSTPAAQVHMTLLQMNCIGCHERDGRGGVGRYRKAYFETIGHVDIGDEGRLPPPLTNVGRKLNPKWLSRVLQGKGSVRPHMRIRMPVFAARSVEALPEQLATVDLPAPPAPERQVFGDTNDLTEPGRQLLDTGCVQCHPLRGEAVPGVVGVDLEGVTSRVHPDWFHAFLLNPGELKPHTRMPSFFPRGVSQNSDLLNGDTNRQIAAMWTYLKGLSRNRLPSKIERARSQSYELKPVDRPVLLRTFMEQAGTHAIVVGFPEQVHFAFDAEQMRLAQLWRGRFVDAQGTWFVRFAPPAQPLGSDVVNLAAGPDLAWLANPMQAWPGQASSNGPATTAFGGYRLDEAGVPVFLYRVGSAAIEDRIVPEGESGLRRTLTIEAGSSDQEESTLWLRVHSAARLEQTTPGSCRSDSGLQMAIDGHPAAAGRLRTHEDSMDWIVPLSLEQPQTIEVRYQW